MIWWNRFLYLIYISNGIIFNVNVKRKKFDCSYEKSGFFKLIFYKFINLLIWIS